MVEPSGSKVLSRGLFFYSCLLIRGRFIREAVVDIIKVEICITLSVSRYSSFIIVAAPRRS